jgi:hypothetical protein
LDAEIVAELRLGKMSYKEIAARFGVNPSQVFTLARVHGVNRKRGRGSPAYKRLGSPLLRRVSSEPIQWPEDNWDGGAEWHLEYPYTPGMPCPFPIVPAGTHPKHDPVGHLCPDGAVHVFNTGIIEKLVRAGLRARVR